MDLPDDRKSQDGEERDEGTMLRELGMNSYEPLLANDNLAPNPDTASPRPSVWVSSIISPHYW